MYFFLELFPNDGDDDHNVDDDDDVKDRSRPVVSESIEAEQGNLLLSPQVSGTRLLQMSPR